MRTASLEHGELPDDFYNCPQAEFNDQPDSLFFNDGVRRVDFVLVYEDEDKKDIDKSHIFHQRKVSNFWLSGTYF